MAGLTFTLVISACVYTPQEEAYTPPPNPQDLLRESAAALQSISSLKFSLTHQRGSIYYRDAGAHIKATEITGEWDAEAGLSLVIDAYLVRGRDVEPTSGTYFPLQMVLVSEGLYITDPLSGQWVLQSPELAIIPVGELNETTADLVSQIEAPNLEGVEDIDGRETYEVSGHIPAAAVDWLSIDLSENAQADIILWIDRQDHLPRQVHLIGAIGEHDDPGTTRQLLLSDFNESVRIDPPSVFIDVR
ncbi:MAG: LppX_LprAFG lipoprotein [Chloroflexi bacterium]|nr:LppX_LprAFG lipoprotein [Chloroflexota bacterium]